MKHIFVFIVASILIVAYSATTSSENSAIANDSFKDKHCECINNDCGCCEHLEFSKFGINGSVCTNFTYLPNDYGISITVTYNNYSVFNETVSGNVSFSKQLKYQGWYVPSVGTHAHYSTLISARNPPPMCFGIPDLEKIQAHVCMRFYDLTFAQQHFHGCVKLSISIYHVIHKSINVGCFNIPREALIDAYATGSRDLIGLLNKELEELAYLKEEIPVVNMI